MICPAAHADDADDAFIMRNNYGTVGLIDMPSARMPADGELAIGVSYFRNIEHFNMDFQIFPWLEGSFRYSGIDHFNDVIPIYYDRAFGIKARLLQESDWLPAVVVGINDVVGTGIYAGEYVAASKNFGSVDATVGIGWGRLGGANTIQNPFSLLSKSFDTRQSLGQGVPGGASFGQFFHGPDAGVFGGIAWKTPVDNLTLIAEVSSDAYVQESTQGLPTDIKAFTPKNQLNFGASYRMWDSTTLAINWLYGTSLGASLAFEMDPTKNGYTQRLGPDMPQPQIRPSEQQTEALALLGNRRSNKPSTIFNQAEMVDALWKQFPGLEGSDLNGQTLTIVLAGGNPVTACSQAVPIVARYRANIDAINVSEGAMSTRCAVPQTLPAATAEKSSFQPVRISAQPLVIDARGVTNQETRAVSMRIRSDLAAQRISVVAVLVMGADVTVYYKNEYYFSEADALQRMTRILMADAPPDAERFRFVSIVDSKPQRQFEVMRTLAERNFTQVNDIELPALVVASSPGMDQPELVHEQKTTLPHLSWAVFPQMRQQLFDVSNPFAVQFAVGGVASLELLPGLSLQTEAEVNIWDDFTQTYANNSVLPHVRTDFMDYFTKGRNGIGQLEANYTFRLAPNVFAALRAGYLESMFAGVGGEALWRPEGERWAVGGDLYFVKQRNFDRLFGFQNYNVVTGHLSVYYDSPWYGLNFELRAGQYLAGDRGLTFSATRRFDTGVEIGAFMTKTNVSAAQFGEGSFDKGIIIRIPLNWMLPINSTGVYGMDIRPVQRDGGQVLTGDATLFDETRQTSTGEMVRQLHN